MCFRSIVLIRGNDINNFSKPGVCILKEIMFSNVKVDNLVENYNQHHIFSVTHSNFYGYIQIKFGGLNAGTFAKEHLLRNILNVFPED